MVSLEEALEIVLGSSRRVGAEGVDAQLARGRVLAEDVAADADVPSFERAVFDGYACRRADLGSELAVVETIRAGVRPEKTVGPRQCAKIMTGAAVPPGADCVIMVELTREVAANRIRFTGSATGDNIRRTGEDIKAGQVVLHAGSLIRAQHIAVLCSFGHIRPLVARRPRVAVVATGDELVEPSAKPGPFQIRNSNGRQLAAQIEAVGAVARDYGAFADVPAEIDDVVKQAAKDNDVVIFSGGVSAGDFDFVPEILRQNKVRLLFEKIAVKPGKPTVFGVSPDACFFGLPGNPVSSFVAFELLVKPFLYGMMGHEYSPCCVQVPLGETVERKDAEREGWVPATISEAGTAEPVEYHGSAHILALCNAGGLISIPVGVARIESGAMVCVRLI
ncbi:MAG: molybdopterin molybdotransferase MoeA [Phycisphaerales bacterium]|nr:MAG: molybdopterin molybdotransferase MoeA [Phycisphaerales bacterium]